MMYNDVDSDLPSFNDPIDGEEIYLFSNPKTSSSTGGGVGSGSSFLHDDDDDHLRHQANVVAGTSSHHLPVVDELLMNSNFLEQTNCDPNDDPLFWECKDIPDDQLNEIWPQNQLNLSGNNISTINSINNINHNGINTTSNTINNCLNPVITLTATGFTNDHAQQQNSVVINHHQPHIVSQIQTHSQQTIIPIQQQQQLHGISTLISQPQLINQQQQHIQIRLHQQQQQQLNTIAHHQQAFNNVLHSQQQQQQQQSTAQLQQAAFQQPHQIIQHLDQYQNKWITVVQTNDQYQAFNPLTTNDQQLSQQQQQVAQFFERLPQNVIHVDGSAPLIQGTSDSLVSSANQPQVSVQIQPQQQQQDQLQQQPLVTTTSPKQEDPPPKQNTKNSTQTQQQKPESSPTEPDADKDDKKAESETSDASKKEAQVKQTKPKERQTRLDCPYCKRSFCKNFDLQQHMRCHTGEKPFQCIVCGRGFAQKSNVKKHMQAHKVWPEGPNNPSIPPSHSSARSRHNSASSSLGQARDDECMQENESIQISGNTNSGTTMANALGPSNDRKNDGNDIFAENRYSCSYCQFNGKTYFELKSHLTIHKREKVFKCIVSSCGKTFSGNDLQSFLDHVTGHKDLIYHCHLCSGQFYSLDEFGEHQKHHSNAQMKKSVQTQSLQSNLTQQNSQVLSRAANTSLRQQNQQVVPPTHLQPQQNHNRQYNQQTTSTPQQTQSQQQPQQQTVQSQSSNHKTTKIVNNLRPQLKSNQKYFRCSKCMNRYTTQSALDHHLSISTHNYPCTECNKVFMCERYLRRHLNTHTTVQYVCTFCDKQFKTAAYLKMHSVVHTGEKPFRCNQCEAAFNRRDKLSRHKLTHETVKKFKCPFKVHMGCTKEFNRPDKLKAHVQTHNGTRPHPCDACSRTFSRLSRLREHKKLHHDMNDNGNLKPVTSTAAAAAMIATAGEADNSKTSDTNNNIYDNIKIENVDLVVKLAAV